MKVAVTLFIKNEFEDIGWWLSYYYSIGVDTIIVFDDHSSDGTWEVIEAASKILDVRPHRTNLDEPFFYLRQKESYLKAIKMYGSEFDWMASLDGDEYISINSHYHVKNFLSEFEHADAIALSWCCYGSNKNAFKPYHSPLRAYDHHSEMSLSDNDLIKSFIRPNAFRGSYIDPHKWDIDENKYVDADGKKVNWKGSGMRPNWGRAKINHYVCRSMEHFLERLEKRSDMHKDTGFWDHFNKNQIQDAGVLKYEHNVKLINYQIFNKVWKKFFKKVKKVKKEISVNKENIKFFEIRCYGERLLCFDMENSSTISLPINSKSRDGKNFPRIFCVGLDYQPEIMYLVREDWQNNRSNNPIYIHEANLTLPFFPIVVEDVEGKSAFKTMSGLYLSANPNNGEVVLNRLFPQQWEFFTLKEIDKNSIELDNSILLLLFLGYSIKNSDSFINNFIYFDETITDVIATVYSLLPRNEQKKIEQAYPGVFPRWLKA